MSSMRIRIELDRQGMRRAALTSPEVRAAVARVGEATAQRARARLRPDEPVVVVNAGKTRARTYVRLAFPHGARTEAKHRVLGRSLGGTQ